jgi:hypothetical protein
MKVIHGPGASPRGVQGATIFENLTGYGRRAARTRGGTAGTPAPGQEQ